MGRVIPDAAVEAAARSFPGYTPEDGADDLEREINAACRSRARTILEAAAPHMERATTTEMASTIREHWAAEVPHPMYPTYVQCMKHGCDWDGRFLGDISEHVAELIAHRPTP